MSGQDAAQPSEAGNYAPRFHAGVELLGIAARRRREEVLDLTQEDVAERFGGPSVAALRRIENGQSDSYRAKTLFSLDTALGWPRGASMVLLSGDIERLNISYRIDYEDWGQRSLSSPVDPETFDELVEYLISTVSNRDIEKYDIPIRASVRPEPREARARAALGAVSASAVGHVVELGRAVETDTAGQLTASSQGIAAAARRSGRGEVTSPGSMTTAQLVDFVMPLNVDDLQRLNDLVKGALATKQFPDIENDLKRASAQVKSAKEHADSLAAECQRQREINDALAQHLGKLQDDGHDDQEIRQELETAREALHTKDMIFDTAQIKHIEAQRDYAFFSHVHAEIQKFLTTEMEIRLGDNDDGIR